MALASRRRSRRGILSLLAGFLMVLLASQTAFGAVKWTKPVDTGSQFSWNLGRGLARTVSSTTSYLHAQYEDDRSDHAGLVYRRGNATGSSWGTTKRLNGSDESAEGGAISAAGANVYVAYVTGAHVASDYDPSAERRVRVRVNTNHGSATAWLSNKTFEAPTRVGRPAVAATGAYAYVAFTDADTGNIVVASNNGVNSEDVGWTAGTAAATTRQSTYTGDGFEGNPVIAASGATVLIAWIDTDAGTLKAKLSTDHGVTWPDAASTLSGDQVYGLSAAADDARFAVAWASHSSIRVRVYTGSWSGSRPVDGFSSTRAYRNGYGTSVALSGANRVGVAWSACTRSSCTGSATHGVDVRWRESKDNGGTWSGAVTIASHNAGKNLRLNDYPSVVVTDARQRFVAYNTAAADFSAYRLVIEVGTGKP